MRIIWCEVKCYEKQKISKPLLSSVAGAMGQQIAMNTALNGREKGYKVILCDSFPAASRKQPKWTADYLAGRVRKRTSYPGRGRQVAASLVINGDVDVAAKEADLVIEAII